VASGYLDGVGTRAAHLALTLIAALLATAALAAPAPAAERVESGRLSAVVGSDPWHLALSESGRGEILAEDPSLGSTSTGRLGYETATGWYHATRILAQHREGAALLATLATNDPLGRRIQLRLAPEREGVLRLNAVVTGATTRDVSHTGIGFGAPAGERYLGFGERSNAVDQRGNEVENYVADGPYQEQERPFIRSFVPPAGYRARDDATYFPMPWLLSTSGYGVLVGNTEPSVFKLASERANAWSLEVESSRLELRFFAGPRPADVVRRLTRFTGRQPKPAAPWFFGPWYQPHGDDAELAQASKLRKADVPASAVNTFLHYLPCGDQQGVEDKQPPRTSGFHDRGYAILTYFNPMICTNYQPAYGQAASRSLLTETAGGAPYLYRYSASTDDLFVVGQFDFSNPEAGSFYAKLLGEAVGDGYDGWMEDFGEYTPLDSRSDNGMTGQQMHNLYPVLYHRASYRYARTLKRPVAGYIRSGWTGVQPYAQLVWGGDPTTNFGFDGLSSALQQALSLGTSGISRWGSDIGGFFALGGNKLTPELLSRWIQFGAVSPIMRTEANGVALPPKDRAQITDPEVLPIWRKYAKLHTQLYPYSRAADATYRRTGMPTMRQLALSFPGDARAAGLEDEFMFGPDLLAAPVLAPDQRTRKLYLPRGRWVDFWKSVSYGERRGSFRPTGARLLRGRREVEVPAPLDELPLMVRAGAVIPMLTSDVDTLASYGKGKGLVRLDERRGRMALLAFPRGTSRAPFNESERLVSKEGRRRWSLRIRANRARRYEVRATLGTLRRPFVPRSVRVSGRELPERFWSYKRRGRTIRIDARVRSRGRIVVSGR